MERWAASVSLSIGQVEGEGPDVFGNVRGLAVDPDGSVYILDDMAQEVRVFDRQGEHLHSWGRRGGGPGEFRYADGIAVDRDGQVWVYDPPQRRLFQFLRDGALVRTVSSVPPGFVGPLTFLDHRTIGDGLFSRPEWDYGAYRSLGSIDQYQPVRVDVDDGAWDTFAPIEVQHATVGRTRVPLTARLAYTWGPDGHLWFSHASEYMVFRRTLEGDTVLVVSLDDARPVQVTDSEADSIVRALRAQPIGPPGDEAVSSQDLPTRTDLPSHKPIVQRILVDDGGHLLVFPEVEGYPVGSVMDVFSTDEGRYFGRVEMPVRVERWLPARARSDQLYVVVRGEYDAHEVVRLDLDPGS